MRSVFRSLVSRSAASAPSAVRTPARRAFSSSQQAAVGSANLDWPSLGFAYQKTNGYLRNSWKDGQWDSKPVLVEDGQFTMNITSNALNYGQAIFEGFKVFHCKDGKVRSFASAHNLARLNQGAARLGMPAVSEEMFNKAVDECVRKNYAFIPPYGSGGSLYMRPMLFGHGPQLGLGPAPEYAFCVVATPVSSYYKSGLKAVDGLVIEDFDRAAPRGVGNVKAAANYGADVMPARLAAQKGYPICLYLDAKEHRYVEEFSTSNFIAIDSNGTFVTPQSSSILQSVTNKVLRQLARDMGLKVEQRPVEFAEVPSFKEVAACGTAVVITPIKSLTKGDKTYKFGELDVLKQLYDRVRAVQLAEYEDKHGWTREI